tara:strand:- start:103 stop:723 length:621 start_codon:yes stop_codon:yes gene_type:complete
MPVKAIRHPTDSDKWMSNFDDYGHGEGNGKSRNSIYKHFRKLNAPKKIEVEEVENGGDGFIKTDWMDDSSETVKAKTIPEPLSEMVDGKFKEFNLKSQGHVIRTMFIGVDRLLTHWGRGVMSNPEWTIDRTDEDYDTLETSTLQLMEYYDVRIPVTPPMIWAVTIGSAYAKPVSHVMKNRDPNRKKKGLFSRLFKRKSKKTEGDAE